MTVARTNQFRFSLGRREDVASGSCGKKRADANRLRSLVHSRSDRNRCRCERTRDAAAEKEMLTALEQQTNFTNGLAEATRFFMGRADVQLAAERLSAALSEMGIPYVIAGGLAVGAHGYQRMTDDVDVLVSVENLSRFKARWIGRGWVERFPGSKNMRDAETGVKVDVLLVGDYPGDGKPKPVCFPSPVRVATRGLRTRVMNLRTLIELKLASGMTAPDRLKDLDDIIQSFAPIVCRNRTCFDCIRGFVRSLQSFGWRRNARLRRVRQRGQGSEESEG